MPTDFTIRRNDTAPVFSTTLKDPDGNPPDLTGASVAFEMKDQTTGLHVVSGACSIVGSPVLGQVSYHWNVGDTSVAGWHYAVFTVTYPSTVTETYPNDHFMTVLVAPSL